MAGAQKRELDDVGGALPELRREPGRGFKDIERRTLPGNFFESFEQAGIDKQADSSLSKDSGRKPRRGRKDGQGQHLEIGALDDTKVLINGDTVPGPLRPGEKDPLPAMVSADAQERSRQHDRHYFTVVQDYAGKSLRPDRHRRDAALPEGRVLRIPCINAKPRAANRDHPDSAQARQIAGARGRHRFRGRHVQKPLFQPVMQIANIDDGYQRRTAHHAGVRHGRSNGGREGKNKLRSAFEPVDLPFRAKSGDRVPGIDDEKGPVQGPFQRRTAEAGAQIGNDRAAVFEERDSRDGRRTERKAMERQSFDDRRNRVFHTPYWTSPQVVTRRVLIGFVVMRENILLQCTVEPSSIQTGRDQSIPTIRLAEITVFLSTMAMVTGPTPPGTGVMSDAFFETRRSPRRPLTGRRAGR